MAGTFLVISGPSGSGKSTLMNRVLKHIPNIYFSISTTTREIREGEKEGVNYNYVTKEEFETSIDNNEFLEWARVHENYYGTALQPIKDALDAGKIVMFDIDVQGHKIVRDKLGDITTSVFITTPTNKILKERLINRGTDSIETIEKRIHNAKGEMACIDEYDYLLINGDLEKTFQEFLDIVKASHHRVANANIQKFIDSWEED